MQAIRTHYLPATNTKPARIRAACSARAIIVSIHKLERLYGDAPHHDSYHEFAAHLLCELLEWVGPNYGPMVGGGYADDMYWVFIKHSPRTIQE